MPCRKKLCANFSEYDSASDKKKFDFVAGIFLAILPKCPFCILAYSGTAMLCAKDSLVETNFYHYSLTSVVVTLFFCSLIVAGLIWNYRDQRTKYALALAGFGILLILNSVIREGGQGLYYTGVSIEFAAVWLNGSLLSILRKFKIQSGVFKRNIAGSP